MRRSRRRREQRRHGWRRAGRILWTAVPIVLGAAVVAAASVVAVNESEDDPEAASATTGALVTPVLSARRVPELLTTPVADRRMQAALAGLMAEVPGASCLTVNVEGREVFADEPGAALTPASVEKLLTATAALEVIPADFRYRTAVHAVAQPEGGVVTGNLYLVGRGDPLLMTDDYEQTFRDPPTVSTDLEGFADAVVAAGVQVVQGGVIGDESRYDNLRAVGAWPARYAGQNVTGPLGALMFNDGYISVTPEPPRPETESEDEPAPNAAPPQQREPAPDPAAHAAKVLTGLLEARGVDVQGFPATGVAPPGLVEVAGIDSPPFEDVVGQMLLTSDNTTAELLVKELGAVAGGGGATVAGVDAMRSTLATLGLPMEGVALADGSGLADVNRVTCRLVQAVLDRAGPASFIGTALPVAGETGTLAERFEGTTVEGRMRAKTGTLRQSTALAGFVDAPAGPTLSFAYIVNLTGPDLVNTPDRRLQRQLGEIMVRYPEVPPVTEVGPQSTP
ncbi:MAG: D-alanyl-D-alanine carboxypeptidase/D-alanyl-D-alanine endopeptidase [Acidimicrobiales bacterium]